MRDTILGSRPRWAGSSGAAARAGPSTPPCAWSARTTPSSRGAPASPGRSDR